MAKGTFLDHIAFTRPLLVIQSTRDLLWGHMFILGLFCGLWPNSWLSSVCGPSTVLLELLPILRILCTGVAPGVLF